MGLCDGAVQVPEVRRGPAEDPRANKEVYVVFRGGIRAAWQRFLNPNFTHVFMLEDMINQKYGQGIMQFEFLNSNINATHLPIVSIGSYIKDLKEAGCSVLHVSPGKVRNIGALMPKFVPYNCVSLTKLYLGIRAYHAITPYGLYKHLSKKTNVTEL